MSRNNAAPSRNDPDPTSELSEHRQKHPLLAGVGVFVVAYLILTAILAGVGTLITDLRGVVRWDVSASRWFVGERADWLDTVTDVGSHLAGTETVIVAGVIVALLLWRRKDWDSIVLLVVALGLEVTVFLSTTLLVDRHRPPVPRLDQAPPTSSFPSGHTAAAVALYIGVLIIFNRRVQNFVVRVVASVLLVAIPVVVALSRLYRGAHFPTDIFAGVLLGLICLLVGALVARMMRDRRKDPTPTFGTSDMSDYRASEATPVDRPARVERVAS